jgi:arginyl-tRNA synthetase
MEDGKPVRMSKRAGNFVTLRDLIDRVGKDVVRFMMLTRHPDMSIDFDFVKVQEHSKENPVFYVHYAHARICSVLRHAKEVLGEFHMDVKKADFSLLKDDAEKNLIKILASYPRMVELAAHHREPHRIAYYLYDVAAHFHSLWNKGKEHSQLRFIDLENKQVTFARLGLIMACKEIIAQGLKIFKIDPMEEMR